MGPECFRSASYFSDYLPLLLTLITYSNGEGHFDNDNENIMGCDFWFLFSRKMYQFNLTRLKFQGYQMLLSCITAKVFLFFALFDFGEFN